MRVKSRIKIFKKIAYVPGDYDVASTPSRAVSTGLKNLSPEEIGSGLVAVEGALGFIPVVGESMALYQGAKLLVSAQDKWDYVWGTLLVTLGLFGLSRIPGGKQALQSAITAAKTGNVQPLVPILKACRVSEYTEIITSKVAGKADINPAALKSAIGRTNASVDEVVNLASEQAAGARSISKPEATISSAVQTIMHEGITWFFRDIGSLRLYSTISREIIDEAYPAIKRAQQHLSEKNFSHLWNGEIEIVSHESLLSEHTSCVATGMDGDYTPALNRVRLADNIVKDYENLTETLLHELGHKQWYSHLLPEQKEMFASKMRVKNLRVDLPDDFVQVQKTRPYLIRFDLFNQIKTKSLPNLIAELEELTNNPTRDKILNFCASAINFLEENWIKASATINPAKYESLVLNVKGNVEKISSKNFNLDLPALQNIRSDIFNYINGITEEQAANVDSIISNLSKQVPSRNVTSVSNYGGTNIEESFAESFAHFFAGRSDMRPEAIKAFKETMNLGGKTVLNSSKLQTIIKISNKYYFACFAR